MSFLFHKTGYLNMMNFLGYGGIKTSDLYLNQTEREVVEGYIRGYEKFLYYMSFARSRHSSYIETGHIEILIQFDRHKLRNFGKLRPFHYHNINNRIHGYSDEVNEMEDRLFTDKPFIPLSTINHIEISWDKDMQYWQNTFHHIRVIITKLTELGIPFEFHTSRKFMAPKPKKCNVVRSGSGITVDGIDIPFIYDAIPTPQIDNSDLVYDFLFEKKQPSSYEEVIGYQQSSAYALPGKCCAVTSMHNYAHPNNLKTWHKIRQDARRRDTTHLMPDIYEFNKIAHDLRLSYFQSNSCKIDPTDWEKALEYAMGEF